MSEANSLLNADNAPEAAPEIMGNSIYEVGLIRGSDIKPEPITWIWKGWLAAGKTHFLAGAPGTGKTTISMAIAATITVGGRWADGTRATPANVVIWSGEDDPRDSLIPRLILSGADVSKVNFVGDITQGNERRSFDPARDIQPLRRRLAGIGNIKLLIVDPIVAAVSGDSHKNAEVRRGLQPLADLAQSLGCALLGITHFSKGTAGRDPVDRLTGSLAFGAVARVVMATAKYQEEGYDGRFTRVLCRVKSNIGPDEGGFEYELSQSELTKYPGVMAPSVLWGKAIDGSARDLLATADSVNDEGGSLADAKRFLTDLLANGPLPAKTVKYDAEGAGYSMATIRRARESLEIKPEKQGGNFGGGKQQWVWSLPAEPLKMLKKTEDVPQNNMNTFREIFK